MGRFDRKAKRRAIGAVKARKEIAAGKTTDMDFDKAVKSKTLPSLWDAYQTL